MDGASGVETTASSSTSHISRDLALEPVADRPVGAGHDRVGLDADASAAPPPSAASAWSSARRSGRCTGSSETWMKKQWSRPISWRICRIDSRNGRDSMSPTVPPTSVMTTSTSGPAMPRMRALISLVMCGITCTVSPRYSPRRSLAITLEYTWPVVTLASPVQPDVEEPLVVTDVQVGLGAVVGDEHLAVLERVHRARVHVEVRVELLHLDPQPAHLQQAAQAGGGEALAQARCDATGDEQMLGVDGPL